jgi:membrane-bound ClpP family serine protease
MAKHPWTLRVIWKYTLLQLPGLALVIIVTTLARQHLDIPRLYAWGIVMLWMAKDVVLFPFVWRAYDTDRQDHANTMIGARGVAKDKLNPAGYVLVRGELWRGEVEKGYDSIDAGRPLRVERVRGLTLLVRPDVHEDRD